MQDASRPIPQRELVAGISRQLDEVLAPLVPAGEPVALVDFPNHSNVGDSAIWAGTVCWLRRRGVPIAYSCEIANYSPRPLRRRLGASGLVLMLGGGNFGDLWPQTQAFRERVLTDVRDLRTVQLPQTLFFEHDGALSRARDVVSKHTDLTVLCRDKRSLALAEEGLGARAVACPDLAFALGPIDRPRGVSGKVLWLGRLDSEASIKLTPPRHQLLVVDDWVLDLMPHRRESAGVRAAGFATGKLGQRIAHHAPGWLATVAPAMTAVYGRTSAARVKRGVALLSTAEVVVTDRLHAHILCLLLGIPHVVLDTGYGKLREFSAAWTRDAEGVAWAQGADEALDLALGMLPGRSAPDLT